MDLVSEDRAGALSPARYCVFGLPKGGSLTSPVGRAVRLFAGRTMRMKHPPMGHRAGAQGRAFHPLIPAKAGIQSHQVQSSGPWIPACAGMSGENQPRSSPRKRGSRSSKGRPPGLLDSRFRGNERVTPFPLSPGAKQGQTLTPRALCSPVHGGAVSDAD